MSHAGKADKLLIKPTAGARPASPCTLGRFIPKARRHGLTPEESQTARRHLAWQRPLTDRPNESHRRLIERSVGTVRLAPASVLVALAVHVVRVQVRLFVRQ
jgi:hypothetical protein